MLSYILLILTKSHIHLIQFFHWPRQYFKIMLVWLFTYNTSYTADMLFWIFQESYFSSFGILVHTRNGSFSFECQQSYLLLAGQNTIFVINWISFPVLIVSRVCVRILIVTRVTYKMTIKLHNKINEQMNVWLTVSHKPARRTEALCSFS